MSKRWLIVLLLISFSFNLAFVGSFLFLRFTMPCQLPPPKPVLGHEPPLRGDFMDREPEIRNLRQKFDNTKYSLMQELAKDPVDEAKIHTIIDSSLAVQNNLECKLGENILAYRKTLTAEEAREHFLRRAEHLKMRSHNIEKIKHRRQP